MYATTYRSSLSGPILVVLLCFSCGWQEQQKHTELSKDPFQRKQQRTAPTCKKRLMTSCVFVDHLSCLSPLMFITCYVYHLSCVSAVMFISRDDNHLSSLGSVTRKEHMAMRYMWSDTDLYKYQVFIGSQGERGKRTALVSHTCNRYSTKQQVKRGIKINSQNNMTQTTISICLLYTSPSPRDQRGSRMPSSA